jgi:cytochrome c553
MRKLATALTVFCVCFAARQPARAEQPAPIWAYPVNPPDFKPSPDDGQLRHVPGSSVAFSVAQTRDFFFAPDWHPDDHPRMPEIVAIGRKPEVFACGFCHRADGPGGPENAGLAGLPAAYIVRQMADFKNGSRKTAVPERAPPRLMIKAAMAASDEEIFAAAAYFSALKPKAIIRIVETDIVPETRVAGWFLADSNSGKKEPIGSRIIEVPEDLAQFETRDARARFIAYAPIGSVKKGEALATKGVGPLAAQCATCHGPGLNGISEVPGLAGRSPSYIVRQLYDFKYGARTGSGSELMKPVVEALTPDDIINLAVYAASLPPEMASPN